MAPILQEHIELAASVKTGRRVRDLLRGHLRVSFVEE